MKSKRKSKPKPGRSSKQVAVLTASPIWESTWQSAEAKLRGAIGEVLNENFFKLTTSEFLALINRPASDLQCMHEVAEQRHPQYSEPGIEAWWQCQNCGQVFASWKAELPKGAYIWPKRHRMRQDIMKMVNALFKDIV